MTYLFAIAKNNGTVDLIVRSAVKAVGGRVALIPWVMFLVTALITAIGAASPAACAIIGPIALGFAGRYRISPLMMGMMVVHGAQAGGFSPISIYGTITNSVMEQAGLPPARSRSSSPASSSTSCWPPGCSSSSAGAGWPRSASTPTTTPWSTTCIAGERWSPPGRLRHVRAHRAPRRSACAETRS